MMKRGVDGNYQDKDGNTACYWAAMNGRVEILQILASHSVDVNLTNYNSITPLMAAARNGKLPAVEFLLKKANANPLLQDKDGKTAKTYAELRGDAKVAKMIADHRPTPGQLPSKPTPPPQSQTPPPKPPSKPTPAPTQQPPPAYVPPPTPAPAPAPAPAPVPDEDIPTKDIVGLRDREAPCDIVKVVIAGNSRNGKSSLCASLMGEPFQATDSTVGIDIRFAELQNAHFVKKNIGERAGEQLTHAVAAMLGRKDADKTAYSPAIKPLPPSQEAKVTVVKEGKLQKEGGMFKTKHYRWHVLYSNGLLYYFENEDIFKAFVKDTPPSEMFANPDALVAGDSQGKRKPLLKGFVRIDKSSKITDVSMASDRETSTMTIQTAARALVVFAEQKDVLADWKKTIEGVAAGLQSPTTATSSSPSPSTATLVMKALSRSALPPPTSTSTTVDPSSFLGMVKLKKSDVERMANCKTLMMFDCGGQEIYATSNELFFSLNCLVVLVFDAFELNQVLDKNLHYLQQWVSSIMLHCPDSPVIIVGTKCRTLVSEYKRISNNIVAHFASTPAFMRAVVVHNSHDNLCFFPVDNSEPRMGMDNLMAAIQSTVMEREIFRKTYPISLVRMIDEIVASKEIIMTYADFEEKISKKYGYEGAMGRAVCQFLFSLGFVVFFDDEAIHHICLKPQTVIDAISNVITTSAIFKENRQVHAASPAIASRLEQTDLSFYNRTGIASAALITALWQTNMGTTLMTATVCEVMIQYLVKLHLMVEQFDGTSTKEASAIEKGKVTYIVPAKLPMNANVVPFGVEFKYYAKIDFYNKESGPDVRVFPPGVFYRLIAKCMNATQLTCQKFEPALSNEHAFVAFGKSKVYLHALKDQHSIELKTDSATPGPIGHLIGLFLDEIIKLYFSQLAYTMYASVSVDGKRVLVDLRAAKEALQANKVFHIDNTQTIQPVVLQDWIDLTPTKTKYDFFLGYRQRPDMESVRMLYVCLQNGLIHNRTPLIFLDVLCLLAGQQWDLSFARSLMNSSVFCPFVTFANVKDVKQKLDSNIIDNVLVEWLLSLEFHRLGIIQSILPIFEDSSMYGFSALGNTLVQPNPQTNEKVLFYLAELKIDVSAADAARIRSTKVSEIYANLCKFQSIKTLNELRVEVNGRGNDWKVLLLSSQLILNVSTKFISPEAPGSGVTSVASPSTTTAAITQKPLPPSISPSSSSGAAKAAALRDAINDIKATVVGMVKNIQKNFPTLENEAVDHETKAQLADLVGGLQQLVSHCTAAAGHAEEAGGGIPPELMELILPEADAVASRSLRVCHHIKQHLQSVSLGGLDIIEQQAQRVGTSVQHLATIVRQ